MGYPVQFPLTWKPFTVRFADVSAADNEWVHPGFNGKLKKITSVLKGAITSVDANITVEIGGVAVTGAALVIANSGSGAGVIDEATASALNSFTAAEGLNVKTDGASSTTAVITVTLWCEQI